MMGGGVGTGSQDEALHHSRVGAGASGGLENLDQVTDGECELHRTLFFMKTMS